MFIRGEKIFIRPVVISDLEPAYKWLNDEEIIGLIGFIHSPSSEFVQRWLEGGMGKDNSQHHFAIIDRTDPIGFIGVRGINWQNKNAELWVFIGEKTKWGKGLGKDAVKTLTKFAFYELGLYRLWVEVFEFNTAAIKMFMASGFIKEGMWRRSYFHKGKYHNSMLLGILREELPC